MIVDALDNTNPYQSLSASIFKVLKFFIAVDSGIKLGTHVIDENIFAIVIEHEMIAPQANFVHGLRN